MPSTDLKYFSMTERSLGFGILLVIMVILPEQGQMDSECIEDLTFFSRVLIWNICVLASLMMFSARSLGTGMMACFLDGPLVVNWTFLALLACCLKAALCISRTFLFGKAGKASFILRAFVTFDAI